MKELNEQWVEIIDGERHMVKVTLPILCYRRVYNLDREIGKEGAIIDLGVLNEEGLLPCPFCGEYPEVQRPSKGDFNSQGFEGYLIFCDGNSHGARAGEFATLQQARDEWNRRAP